MKKKNIAPLIVGGIAGLCVIAIIVAISTNPIGTSKDNGISDNPSQTTKPVSPDTPAGETDSNGHQGASASGPDIMFFARKDDFMVSLFYTDGAAAIMLCRVIN